MKLLVLILTSSKIKLLKRAIKSVENQFKVSLFSYELKIVVNTLNDEYYKEVVKTIKNIEIIRTESNGSPGKGHNSCLKIFQDREEYTHMTMLDGDDLFYPSAFQQFEKMLIKEPKLDLVHLLLNDKVHYSNPDKFNCKKLKFNLKLISAFRSNDNWWKIVNTKNPFIEKIEDTKTPSRIILVSRKIFYTSLPIKYSEEMKLYDDMLAFVSFYDAQLKGEINTFSTSETNIYCYNALNDHSASYNFKERERENIIFRKEIIPYKYAIQDNWNIKELPFIKVEQPDNFLTKDKVKFCNKFVVDFEVADKYDELKIIQEKNLNNEDIKELEKIEKIYKFLINIGFDTKNNLFKIAEIHFINQRINEGLIYLMKLASCNPNVSVYKKIFDILYRFNIYDKCNYYYNLIKKYDEITEDIEKKYQIILNNQHSKNGKLYYKDNKFHINFDEDKEIFCYYTGYTDDFNGKNYGEKSAYGSEIAAIKLCEQLTDKYNVIILCNSNEVISHNKVLYLNQKFFNELNNNNKINHFVISRFISNSLDMDLTKIENLYLLLHDTRAHEQWHNSNLPLYSCPLFGNLQNKIKKVIFVSKWQKDNFRNILEHYNKLSLPEDKCIIIPNGINTKLFKYKNVEKKKNRFIYCSNPTRGLEMLCEILIELQKKYKDITLDIYFGNLPQKFKKYIDNYDWIKYNGKISNEKLTEEFSKSDFWLYPNMNSHETFCISCLEAMCGGNVVISRDFSALPELIKNNGVLIPKELKGDEFKKYVIERLEVILEKEELKHRLQEKAYKSSLKYDWKTIAEMWRKLL